MFRSVQGIYLIALTHLLVVLNFTSCISIDPDDEEIQNPFQALKADTAIVEDTFSIVYRLPKSQAKSLPKDFAPNAVYTTNFWKPAFFEYSTPAINTIPLARFNDTLWFANIIVPKTAQVVSYYISGVQDSDSLNTTNFIVLDKNKKPIKATWYRFAMALNRSGADANEVMNALRNEIDRFSDTYDAYILYWSVFLESEKALGEQKAEQAIAKIESQMQDIRFQRRGNPDLLQAIALTYIYTLGDRVKANRVLQDSPDSYLHPLNLYNRFLTEVDIEKRELALSVMAEKYPTHPLAAKMYQHLLFYYIANQRVYAERAAILSEKIWKRNNNSLKNNGVMTGAIRYLFDYYGKVDLSRAMPYVKEVLRLDYDRQVYDVATILQFSERFAESQEYSGLAIDLASKALQALDMKEAVFLNPSGERDFVFESIENGEAKQDLLGRGYYCIGKAYRRINDLGNAIPNLQLALRTCLSRRSEIYYELANAYLEVDKKDSENYALLSAAYSQSQERLEWITKTYKLKLKKNETIQDKIEEARRSFVELAPDFSLTKVDGQTITINTRTEKILLLYFWSPTSTLSKLLFSDLQLLYAKYRARGVELYAIDTDSSLATVKSSPSEFGYSYPFVSVDKKVLSGYKTTYLPTAIVIKNGIIISRQSGYDRDLVSRLESDLQQFFMVEPVSKMKKVK